MAINETILGESVYTSSPFEERAATPLYHAVGDLVARYCQTGQVLDIGCNDGAATYNFPGDYQVIGIDMCRSALQRNHTQLVAQADMRKMPLRPGSAVDTVLMLDIVEHESWRDSLNVLKDLKATLRAKHSLIVSMPIVSAFGLEAWKEGLDALRHGRPEMGLFDRTHKILHGQHGHKKLFHQAGYGIVESHTTNLHEGIVGEWSFKPAASPGDHLELSGLQGLSRAVKIVQLMRTPIHGGRLNALYKETQRPNHPRLQALAQKVMAYQGVYVLQPK